MEGEIMILIGIVTFVNFVLLLGLYDYLHEIKKLLKEKV